MKHTYISIGHPTHKTSYIDTIEGAIAFLENMHPDEDKEGFLFKPVEMTVDEFLSLPEFSGF